MQTEPKKDRRKLAAAVAAVAFLCIGGGFFIYMNPAGPATTTTGPSTTAPLSETGYISNTRIGLNELFGDIAGLYFGSSVDQALHLQLFQGSLTETLSNVTLDLGGFYSAFPTLHVSQGTLTARVVPVGLSLTFQGQATTPGSKSEGARWNRRRKSPLWCIESRGS